MKFRRLTFPSLLAGRRGGRARGTRQPRPVEAKRSRPRPLTNAEQALLDRRVAEARAEVRAEVRAKFQQRTKRICRLCESIGRPDLAAMLICETSTDAEVIDRLCGRQISNDEDGIHEHHY